jgi:septal ring-binding cell division protein DamX
MMAQPVVTRSQRRIERKQVILIAVLILAVAGVSFTLGVMFGQSGGTLPVIAADVGKPKLPMVVKVAPPPPLEVTSGKPEKLTFYDNLPKGNQAPLGSGINLPPEKKSRATKKKKSTLKSAPVPLSQKLSVSSASTPPATSTTGAFVVQIASFRTSEDAGKLAHRLKSHKMAAFIESADLGEKGVWHRVLVGPYKSRENADQAAAFLKEKERFSVLVRQR